MVTVEKNNVKSANTKSSAPAASQCYRYNRPFASPFDANAVLNSWRKSPNWIVPAGYADYSCVNRAADSMFYIDVNISPNLHGGNGCNSYLMAATG